MNILEYIEKKGFDGKRRGEEFITNCPFCGDTEKKFQINLIHGAYICNHANRCGRKGSFYDLQRRLGDTPVKLNKTSISKAKKKNYTLPNKDIPPMNDSQIPVYKYLKARGFDDDIMKGFRLGAKENTIMLPYFKNGVLVNIKYRDIYDKKKMWMEKDAEHTLFNRDNISGNNLFICEGEFDCIALKQYGIDAVSVPNGATGIQWLENEWDYIDTFTKIYLCFDNDEAGITGANNLAKKIGIWKCLIVKLPKKDANECLLANVPTEEIMRCIDEANEVTSEDIVSPVDFSEQIKDIFNAGNSLNGTGTAWDELDSIIKGWRGGEVTIWTGKNGSGKSTILNQCFLDIGKKGERTCIYSGEMPPQRYLRWALVQLSEKIRLTHEEIDIYLDWMNDRVYILNIIGGIEPEKLLQDFEYAARRYNVKHFIIDSLMKIMINDGDEYQEQKKFVSSLCDFAKKFNVHIHLVAHPRKTQNDADHVGKVDVKGSSHITDLADNVICLVRIDEEVKERIRAKNKVPCDMYLYVKKNREFGIEGRISFQFNEDTKKFCTMG